VELFSYGRTLSISGPCSKSRPILRNVGVIEKLLLDEEAKLKKHKENHKKE
jgi:hypothetical protein